MQLAVQFIIPLLLGVSAIWLAFQEFYNYNSERKMGRTDNLKLCRRLFGSLILLVIAYMIYSGDTSLIFSPAKDRLRNAATQEQAIKVINYWSCVLGLVFLSVFIAIWDVIAGLSKIRRLIDENEKHEVAIVKDMIASVQRHNKAKAEAAAAQAAMPSADKPDASPSMEPSATPPAAPSMESAAQNSAIPSADMSIEKENTGSEAKIVRTKKEKSYE